MIVDKSLIEKTPNVAFDAATGKVVNMMETGVIDPTKVVRCALVNASGVASLMITTEAVIVEEEKPDKAKPAGPPMDSSY